MSVTVRYAIALAGAVFAALGCAHAQTPAQEATAVEAQTPWYERFTVTQSPAPMLGGQGPLDRRDSSGWRVNGRWGVTVDLADANRPGAPLAALSRRDEAALGAYYHFSPNLRVGGEVSLSERRELTAPLDARQPQPAADMRIQSAFRF